MRGALVLLAAGMLLLAGLVPATVAAKTAPPHAQPSTASLTPGAVVIDDGAEWTNNTQVSIALPYPSNAAGLVRLSNDGSHWSPSLPWAPEVIWDLTDPATGGTADDGTKTVTVQWADGTLNWATVGSDSIKLDRTAPSLGPVSILGCRGGVVPSNWVWLPCRPAQMSEEGNLEFSLDGGPWTPFDGIPSYKFDFRTLLWGGSWRTEDRQICWRLTDYAGNLSEPGCDTVDLDIPSRLPDPSNMVPMWNVRFDLPRPAVTGQLFTINPIYPPDMPAMPATATCWWILRWGDEGKVLDMPNEDYGSVWIRRTWGSGGCGEWTFTLPYTPGLNYQFSYILDIDWHDGNWDAKSYLAAYDENITVFTATVGTYERGIPHSTIGLAYLLPEQSEARVGEPMTYTLHASDTPGWSLPKPGQFWASNFEICGHEIDSDWTSATSFTYTPDCQGSWDTGWWWSNPETNEWLQAEFDPPADKAPPTVTAPRALPVDGSQVSSTIPTTISWTATDPVVHRVNTGVGRSELQVSRNGGAWKNVALSSPKATSVVVNLLTTGSYRFRVRAFDAVGNKSLWKLGPTLKPRLLQESKATFGAGWGGLTGSSLSAGAAKQSTSATSTATFKFYGRAVSWVGSLGPGKGLAQVYVDGVLKQTVDLVASTASDRRELFTYQWNSAGHHTLVIKVLGTYGRPAITVDAFVVLG